MASVIGIRPEKLALHKELHAQPWPEMNVALRTANIHNCSIYLREPENLLFAYREYTGTVFDGHAGARRPGRVQPMAGTHRPMPGRAAEREGQRMVVLHA